MPEPWDTALAILASLGGGGVIVFALSSWLGKVWASRILAGEQHKLEMLRTEHQIRFSKLHEEQAKVIKQLYSKLLETRLICARIIIQYESDTKGISGAKEELLKELFEHGKSNDLQKFYKDNEIFLPESVVNLIDNILESDDSIWLHAMTDTDLNQERKSVLEIAKDLEAKIDILLKKVKEEFRGLLGVK